MTDRIHHVAKVRIVVTRDEPHYLLLIKRSTNPAKHNHLEMPGGHLDGHEKPLAALLRELREEESTGRLAALAASCEPPLVGEAGGATHYLFDLNIDADAADWLRASPAESLGFQQLPCTAVEEGRHDNRLTPRTRAIFARFGPSTRR